MRRSSTLGAASVAALAAGALAVTGGFGSSNAIRRYRRIVSRLPLPEHVIGLGEAELAAGRRAAGRRDLELVQAQRTLLEAARVDADVELAVFEADHGDPRRALALARRGWAAAPSVRSADAVGWALARSGRPAAALPGHAGRCVWDRSTRCGAITPAWPRWRPAGRPRGAATCAWRSATGWPRTRCPPCEPDATLGTGR